MINRKKYNLKTVQRKKKKVIIMSVFKIYHAYLMAIRFMFISTFNDHYYAVN